MHGFIWLWFRIETVHLKKANAAAKRIIVTSAEQPKRNISFYQFSSTFENCVVAAVYALFYCGFCQKTGVSKFL